MFGCCNSSAKTYVFCAEVACVMRPAAALGAVADLASATNGASALMAREASMLSLC